MIKQYNKWNKKTKLLLCNQNKKLNRVHKKAVDSMRLLNKQLKNKKNTTMDIEMKQKKNMSKKFKL